jgi:hypothetical protein
MGTLGWIAAACVAYAVFMVLLVAGAAKHRKGGDQ